MVGCLREPMSSPCINAIGGQAIRAVLHHHPATAGGRDAASVGRGDGWPGQWRRLHLIRHLQEMARLMTKTATIAMIFEVWR